MVRSVLTCIVVQHDLSLVLLAGALCAFGSWVTSRLYKHANEKSQRRAFNWYLWTAFTAGISVWSTHFVAMLGYRPNVPVSLDMGLTFASLGIAIVGCTIGVICTIALSTKFARLIGGAMFGLAASGMHYAGMIAYRAQGIIYWDFVLLGLSIFLAVTLAALAFHFGAKDTRWSAPQMVALLTSSIIGLHFTGMTAFSVEPLAVSTAIVNLSALKTLAVAIAVCAAVVVFSGLFSYVLEDRITQEHLDELTRARNEAEAASKAKSEFLSVLSHELRTPLTIILGYAGVLAHMKANHLKNFPVEGLSDRAHFDKLGDQTEFFGAKITVAGNHLLALINEVLDYSKMDLQSATLSTVRMSVRDLLFQVQADFEGIASDSDCVLEVDCPDIDVVADRRALMQIVFNLVNNAFKFSGSDKIILRASSVGGELHLAVQDFGCGIPEGSLERIFQAFHQVDSTASRRQEGVGLGLAICKTLAVAHGGDISVSSHVGVGTVFTVTLPDCTSPNTQADTPRAQAA